MRWRGGPRDVVEGPEGEGPVSTRGGRHVEWNRRLNPVQNSPVLLRPPLVLLPGPPVEEAVTHGRNRVGGKSFDPGLGEGPVGESKDSLCRGAGQGQGRGDPG